MKTKLAIMMGFFLAGTAQAAGWVTSGTNNYVNDGGNVGINTTSPGATLDVWQPAATGFPAPRFIATSDTDWHSPLFTVERSRGSKTSQTPVVANDSVGVFDFWAMSSSGRKRAAQLVVRVDGAPGAAYVPAKIQFITTNSAGVTAQRMVITADGKVGINTGTPGTYSLAVNGSVRAKEIVVDSGWADYVFTDEHKLMPLPDLKDFIAENGHLPGLPTEEEVRTNGVAVSKATTSLLEKVEQLTLYVIQLDEENKSMKQQLEVLQTN